MGFYPKERDNPADFYMDRIAESADRCKRSGNSMLLTRPGQTKPLIPLQVDIRHRPKLHCGSHIAQDRIHELVLTFVVVLLARECSNTLSRMKHAMFPKLTLPKSC